MITPEEMRRLERNAQFYGISEATLMELAGKGLADSILKRVEPINRVVLIAGLGNNAGDGFVALRYLMPYSQSVEAYVIGSRRNMSELSRRNMEILEKLGVKIVFDRYGERAKDALRKLSERDVLLDGLFGIGLRGSLGEPYVSIIREMNKSKAFKVAIDIPSGDDRIRFRADLTVSFHDIKSSIEGEYEIIDIGLKAIEKLVGPGDVLMAYKKRDPRGHKGNHGIVAVIGGGKRYVGAAVLASRAAMILSDLAYILTPTGNPSDFRMYPEIIATGLDEDLLEKAHVFLIGPGLDEEALDEVLRIVNRYPEKPKVIDATALRREFVSSIEGVKILTPHAGEIKRLGFEPTPEGASMAAVAYEAIVLLKGHTDIITDGVRLYKNPIGKPSMTVGGTGDVLSGLVAGFLARGSEPIRAAAAAAFLNSYASERMPIEGLTPTKLIEEITLLINEITSWSYT